MIPFYLIKYLKDLVYKKKKKKKSKKLFVRLREGVKKICRPYEWTPQYLHTGRKKVRNTTQKCNRNEEKNEQSMKTKTAVTIMKETKETVSGQHY